MRSNHQPFLVAALVTCVIAGPALAQQSSGGYPSPCESSKVSKGDVDRAHTVFLSGKQYLEESNYDKAISYFKDAYTIDCSVHGILPIIATAFERKGDRAEAVRALEEYLRRAPGAPDREVVERRIKNLNDQIAREQPQAQASATTAPPPTATSTAPVETATTTPPTPPPPPAGGEADAGSAEHSVAPWIVVGLGAAVFVTGAVVVGIGAGDVSSAQQACPTRQGCSKDIASQGNDGRSKESTGVVVGAIGLAAVTGGLLWHFLEKGGETRTAQPTVVVAPQYAGLALGGAF